MKSVFRNGIWSVLPLLSILMSLMAVGFCMATFLTGCSSENASTINGYNFPVIEATDDFYVNDFAGLFTAEQKDEMMQKAIALDQNNGGIQVVVTTVKTLKDCLTEESGGNKNIDQISVAMYNQYGIGQDDMGILILFASEDREVKIATGHEMQAYITDGQAGELLDDYGMEYFANDQFAQGLVSVQDAVISKIQTVVPSDWNAGKQEEAQKEEQSSNATQPITPVSPTNPSDTTDTMKSNVTQAEEKTSKGGFVTMIQWVLGALAVAFACLFGYSTTQRKKEKAKAAKELKDAADNNQETLQTLLSQAEERRKADVAKITSSCDERIRRTTAKIDNLTKELDTRTRALAQKEQECCQLIMNLEALQEKYSRMQKLHPELDFEAEIQAMIESEYKTRAAELDKDLAGYVTITPDKDQVSTLYHALEIYKNANHEVWKYLKTDVNRIQALYDESKRLKAEYEQEQKDLRDKATAQRVYESMMPAYTDGKNNGATYKNYSNLKNAFSIYQGLNQDEKRFFPDAKMARSLEDMVRTAEIDSQNKTAARNVESEVESVVNRMSRADEDDMDKLERLLRRYNSLTSAQQKHFDVNLVIALENLLRQARDDHDRQERRRRDERARKEREEREARERRQREEAARRAFMSSSSSSFGGSSHSGFGGHGGRASGGGASRRF